MSTNAAMRVDEGRLWKRLMEMARHGATPAGGVNRQALSVEDAAARRQLVTWGDGLGLKAFSDPAGNLFLRYEGETVEAAPVLIGSHLDSQPTGGRFDGVYGVLAALETLEAIREAGIRIRRPIEIVAWMNEEGSRFAPGMMGSEAYSGTRPLAEILTVKDSSGTSVEAALAQMPVFSLRALGGRPSAYLEAHIEQGPVLEHAGISVGVVTGIQGKITYRVTVTGEEAHAGTSTRRERKNALSSAVAIISALETVMHDAEDVVKFTVGSFTVSPNVPSVVPRQVVFSIDLRHPDSDELFLLGGRVAKLCAAHRGPCSVDVRELTQAKSLVFPDKIQTLIRAGAKQLGIPVLSLPSAAGHDARHLHGICPTGMIFVTCRDGLSHIETEWAEPAHLADGARVLAFAVENLATST